MVAENLAGMILFILGTILMFILVPMDRIIKFSLLGLIGGLGVALVLVHVMQNIFSYWVFKGVDLLYIRGIPVLLSSTWIPIEIIFGHLTTKTRSLLTRISLLFAVPLASAFVHYLLILNKMLSYNYWNLTGTFLVSLAIHAVILGYLYATGMINEASDKLSH